MKKILITLLLTTGFSCLSLNAQKPLKKPQKKPTVTTPAKPQPGKTPNKPARPQPGKTPNKPAEPQKTHTQSSAPRVAPTTGTINGHEYVDLGLSVKWATCNVGASSPSDYGDYFAWGETSTKSEYTEANSVTYNKSMSDIAGDSRYDAARAKWGSTWRLPTTTEIDELVKKCEHKWTTQGGHNGYLVTGPNGKSIFLPAAGWRNITSLYDVGENGYYWSSAPDESVFPSAYCLYFDSGRFYWFWYSRNDGRTVRPVSE